MNTRRPLFKELISNPEYIILSAGGLGLLPRAPGTWGSLGTIVALFFLQMTGLPGPLLTIFAITLSIFATALIHFTQVARQDHDPSWIVIDEVAGLLWGWIICAPFLNNYEWLAFFILFRILDIFKPWPISFFDRNNWYGLGVMLDDIAAGLIGAACILVFRYFYY